MILAGSVKAACGVCPVFDNGKGKSGEVSPTLDYFSAT
jgi:hypothetical protein